MSEAKVNRTLQKAIRAARRNYKEPARRLLAEVLQEDPDNEEAWMWLYRVADTPQQRADCLHRILAINPDNQWALEQSAALQAEAAAPAPAEKAPRVLSAEPAGLKLEPVKCPKCGGTTEPRGGSEVKTLVCSYCRSVIDLTGEQAAAVGQMKKRVRPVFPIEPGMEGTFDGERYQVIGWLRYEGWDDEDRWRWDEWLLASTKGEFRWLSYDEEEGFVLQKKIKPPRAFNPATTAYVPVPGGSARVGERARCRIVALAGEMTWRARVGEQSYYLDAQRGAMRYSVEYTKDEIELFEGRSLPPLKVWRAFGLKELEEQALKKAVSQNRYRVLAVVTGILVAFSCVGILIALISGRHLLTQEVYLTLGGDEQVVGPFEVTQPGRIHKVSLTSGGLPTNSWAVVDVSAFDGMENEYYLYSEEFWDEAGQDSDGPWHESDLYGEYLFRPDDPGWYTLELSMEEATVDSVQVTVSVYDGIWVSHFFIAFAVVGGVLCFVFASLSVGRLIGGSVLKAMAEATEED